MTDFAELRSAPYVSLKTFRKSGIAVATPVWWAMAPDNSGYIFSAGHAGKIKRLRNNTQAELALCDVRGNLLGEWVAVHAEVVTQPLQISTALKALRDKYGWQMKIADAGAKLTGKFNKRAYIRISRATQHHPSDDARCA